MKLFQSKMYLYSKQQNDFDVGKSMYNYNVHSGAVHKKTQRNITLCVAEIKLWFILNIAFLFFMIF